MTNRKQVPPLRPRSCGSGRDDEEERGDDGTGAGGGSRYRLRQQQSYGRQASSALQWGAVGCTEVPRKSGESAGEFRRKAGERRGAASETVQSPESFERKTTQVCGRRDMHGTSRGRASGSRNPGGLSMADAREVMNIRQASQYLGVSPDTLYKYVSEEKIPAFKLGNRWKFKKSILDTWMENKSLNSEVSRPRKLMKSARATIS